MIELMFEVIVKIRTNLSTDSDTLQHTVTSKLVKDQIIVHKSRFFDFIGDDAANKVRLSRAQIRH